MQKILFTEEYCHPGRLAPFSLVRRVHDIRTGILTIRQKWEKMLKLPSFDKWHDDYKDDSHAVKLDKKLGPDPMLLVHSNVLPDKKIISAIKKLKNGDCLSAENGDVIAFRFSADEVQSLHKIKVKEMVVYKGEVLRLTRPWDIFQLNDRAIRQDFELLTAGRRSQPIPKTVKTTGSDHIFIEKGARLSHAILNASTGPIYIGRDAEIMEGCLVRGPFALCEGAVLKMGAKVYGATTIGPWSVVGGEIKNSVIMGYSNKAHDGYLGDAVLGEWCNLGAGTSNSNLKNTASDVRVWDEDEKDYLSAGLKCGLLMGDYSRSAINTSFNTGTVVGVCVNVFGEGLTPKFIPHFSWGSEGIGSYQIKKALKDVNNWKKLKNQSITEPEKRMLEYIFDKM